MLLLECINVNQFARFLPLIARWYYLVSQ